MATEMGRMPFFYNQEGRLVQVDYALQAGSRGSTTLGLKTKDFALLSSQVKPTRPLMEPAEKGFVVDDHIGATGSGYIGDGTTLLDQARGAAPRHRGGGFEAIRAPSIGEHGRVAPDPFSILESDATSFERHGRCSSPESVRSSLLDRDDECA